eukprot:m.371474 g.371474  ORF g.371474 m.371474 type:complete len:70 (-) comp20866_c0_seq7:237-446(-)
MFGRRISVSHAKQHESSGAQRGGAGDPPFERNVTSAPTADDATDRSASSRDESKTQVPKPRAVVVYDDF